MNYHDKLFNDLIFLYSNQNHFSDHIADQIKKDIAWAWTDTSSDPNIDGKVVAKYFGCTYWSEKALDLIYPNWAKGDFKPAKHRAISILRHEHVFPKLNFIKSINAFFSKPFTDKDLSIFRDKMFKYYSGCVITKDEATDMDSPDAGLKFMYNSDGSLTLLSEINDNHMFWQRYIKYNKEYPENAIAIYKCNWERRKKSWALKSVEKVDFS